MSDLAQLKGKMETPEKDLLDTRKNRNHSISICNDLEARCKAQDGEIKDQRYQVQDLNDKAQARDKEIGEGAYIGSGRRLAR